MLSLKRSTPFWQKTDNDGKTGARATLARAPSPLPFYMEKKMTQIPKLTPRLRAAADMVREGVRVADIGTDHAYLPITLCLEGKIRGGVVSDINVGPVERAKQNINTYGLSEKLTVARTDGLVGLDNYSPDDILILGMGGELIARILSDAPWTKNSGIQLCLQPMTHPEALRAFLCDNGYAISDERLVAEEDRIYQLICAVYTGEQEEYEPHELLLGKINIEKKSPLLSSLAEKYIKTLEKRIGGKRMSGESVENELSLLRAINKMI